MRFEAHVASAILACTPGAERTIPTAMQQFHLQYCAWVRVEGSNHRLVDRQLVGSSGPKEMWVEYTRAQFLLPSKEKT